MKNHLNFFPEHGVAITLPPSPTNSKTLCAFIPLNSDDDDISIKPDYNLVLDEEVLILRLSIRYDKDINKDKNMSFCCIKIEKAYQNEGIKMIVIQTKLKNNFRPPQDRTLSRYPEWDKNTITFTLEGKTLIFGDDDKDKGIKIPRNPRLRLDARRKDSCTIPPKED